MTTAIPSKTGLCNDTARVRREVETARRRRSGDPAREARGEARAGLTLLEILIVVAIIAAVLAISIPMILQSKAVANEASAMHSLRAIFSAEQQYHCINKQYTDVQTLVGQKYLGDQAFANGYKSGYRFITEVSDPPWHWYSCYVGRCQDFSTKQEFAV
ncbi:MAG: type II secretion system protein, partial [Planctomycetota bacterium]|nr:type II secretion system protein [Planctomycetota bacterium]